MSAKTEKSGNKRLEYWGFIVNLSLQDSEQYEHYDFHCNFVQSASISVFDNQKLINL